MAHPPPRRGSPPSNKGNNGLGHRTGAANLADEDDALRLGVVEEDLERIGVRCPREGVTTDTYHERLSETHRGRLCDGFVCEGAGAGDDPYMGC